MVKIDLFFYKNTKPYFRFFDAYLKTNEYNKEDLFYKLCINSSSYRRCRENEQKIGKEIISILSKHFKFDIPNDEYIDNAEKIVNNIFNNIYYKISNTYDTDMELLEKLLSDNTLLFPIIKLMKILLMFNSNDSIENTKNKTIEVYQDIVKYKLFFTDTLKELLEITGLLLDNDSKVEWNKNYKNPMAYQVLSANAYTYENYVEAIFYGEKAKEILLKELNFKRYFSANRTVMSSLLYIGNYQECYEQAYRQKKALTNFNYDKYEMSSINHFYLLSLIGLRRYSEALETLKSLESFTLSTLSCYLIALYNTDKIEYKTFYNDLINDEIEVDFKEFIILFDNYLKKNNKNGLNKLKDYNIDISLVSILKRQNLVD